MNSFRDFYREHNSKLDRRRPFDKKLDRLETELMSWSECFIDLHKLDEILKSCGLDVVEVEDKK